MAKSKRIKYLIGICKECEVESVVGEKTGQCLSCLDWKMDELNK